MHLASSESSSSSESPPSASPPSASPPSFDEAYEQTLAVAYRTLRRKGVRVSDLDDACQEVFVIVDQLLRKGTLPHNLKAWVAGIAITVAERQRSERRRHEARVDQEADLATIAAAGEETDTGTQRAALEAFVRSLVDEIENDQQRHVITLHYLAELSIAEIMGELKRPEGTVKKQVAAGRRRMEEALARRIAHGGKDVVPLFGVVGLLESLPNADPPDGMRERVRGRLRDLGCGGGSGGGGGGPIAPAMPAALPPAAPLAVGTPTSWSASPGVVVGSLLGLLPGIIIGALWDPLHGSHTTIEMRPDALAAAVTASAAPSVAPAPSAAPSASPVPLSMPAAPGDRSDIDAERVVLERGQVALKGGRVKDALDAIEKHARRWHDRGELAPKREELRADLERYMAEHPNDPEVVDLRTHRGTP